MQSVLEKSKKITIWTLQESAKRPHTDDHIKLYTHNENVDLINKKAFDALDGDKKDI
jgi:hypothetical protein